MTHCQRVLDLLSDGKWHTHHELYALHVIAHSRISELRGKGHVIEAAQQRDPFREGQQVYLYRLILPKPEQLAMEVADVCGFTEARAA